MLFIPHDVSTGDDSHLTGHAEHQSTDNTTLDESVWIQKCAPRLVHSDWTTRHIIIMRSWSTGQAPAHNTNVAAST